VIAKLEQRIGRELFGRVRIGFDPEPGQEERRRRLLLAQRCNDFFVVPGRDLAVFELTQHPRRHVGVKRKGDDFLVRRCMIETW
jgi:hypothetical protein